MTANARALIEMSHLRMCKRAQREIRELFDKIRDCLCHVSPKTREKALNIALNKITGAWDDNLLADLLKDIENSSFDLGFTGFDPPEIETLFNKVHSKEVKEDDFDVDSELKQPCFSKTGDIEAVPIFV